MQPSADPTVRALQEVLGDGYVVGRELTGGGMSRVFVVDEPALERKLVAKVLLPELAAGVSAERFKREISLTARLQHPQIVPIFAAGEVDGLPFFTMPFVSGASLRERLRSGEPVSLGDAVSILRDVARALEHAHALGIVHRDIKPENVLMAGRSAVVTDFGVAKALSASTNPGSDGLTSNGYSLGTPAYMAPEQAAADPNVDHRADMYTLGILAYELLCGRTPFAARGPRGMIAAHITEAPRHLSELSPQVPPLLADLVMRCLAKDPDNRVQTATEFLAGLDESMVYGFAGAASLMPAATAARELSATNSPMTIAVMPFTVQGGESDAVFLADGIAEEVLNTLARLPTLRVAARASAFALKGRDADVREVGRVLGVSRVVDGTLRQAGKRLRVNARLTTVSDGFLTWSDRFDRELEDVFEIQDEVATAIVNELQVALFNTRGDPVAKVRRPTSDMEAYEQYLRARYFLNQRVDGMWKAMEHYQRALDRDPAFALAHAGVAEGYYLLTVYAALSPAEGSPKAREAALRALELDPTMAEAEVVLSTYALWYDWNVEESLRRIERALRLKPSDPLAHSCHACCFAVLGRHAESIAAARRAVDVDPLALFAHGNLIMAQYLASQFDDAIATCDKVLELSPQNSEAYRWSALCLFQLGRREEALASVQKAVDFSGRHFWPLANQAAMFARVGRRDEAMVILEDLRQREAHSYVPPLAVASVEASLGDLDGFFASMERAIEVRDFWLPMLRVDPGFAGLKKLPRFVAMLETLTPASAVVTPAG